MPIPKNWSQGSKQHVQQNVPQKGGVYELRAFGELAYIGKASNLQRRLLTHLSERNPNYYRFETAGFLTRPAKMEKTHLNRYGQSQSEMPPWNSHDPR